MYSPKNLLTQSPEKVKMTFLSVLGVVAALRGWDPTLIETVGVGIAVERVLDMFYVAPTQRAQLEELHTTTALQGIELGKQLARVRPLRADPEPDSNVA